MLASPANPLLQDLRDRIRGIEGPRVRDPGRAVVGTGFPAFDRLLAGGGLPRGALTEWRSDSAGGGALTLALAVVGHVIRSQGTAVVIDAAREFYPVAAAQLGVPPDRTIVVRPDDPTAALWAWEESLRFPGVAVTVGRLGEVNDKVVRRLQLAVEAGGGLGFLVRQPGAATGAAWGATRVGVESNPGDAVGRRLRVRVTR
ncbi:MAG TPA: hypothetical protein VM597_34895, partial [Gemmataceae bacterium]|nr:hypothetical protein [Gemmataceae bacterium]